MSVIKTVSAVLALQSGPHTPEQLSRKSGLNLESSRRIMRDFKEQGWVEFSHFGERPERGGTPMAYVWKGKQ